MSVPILKKNRIDKIIEVTHTIPFMSVQTIFKFVTSNNLHVTNVSNGEPMHSALKHISICTGYYNC